MKNSLNISPIAEEIAQLIIDFNEDVRLKWNKDGSVQILIGNILPEVDTSKQTIGARRKRFRTNVEELLSNAHWEKIRVNIFMPLVNEAMS